jgi:hypothetical protein
MRQRGIFPAEATGSGATHPLIRDPFLNESLCCLAAALGLAALNISLGRTVSYLEHLPLFNLLAAAMLSTNVGGLALGLWGIRRIRGKSLPLLMSSMGLLVLLSWFLIFDG